MYEELKISAPRRKDYEREKGDIDPETLVFIEDEDRLVTPEKEYQFVPSDIDIRELADTQEKDSEKINGLQEFQSALPCPKSNQIVYTTTDSKPLGMGEENVGNIGNNNVISDEYYQTFGIVTYEKDLTQSPDFRKVDIERIKSVTFPSADGFKIVLHSFNGAINLESVVCPKLLAIDGYAFRGCKKLKDIVLPEGIESLGDYSFEECVSLENLNLPEGLKKIGNYIFTNCGSLKSLEVPTTVESIGSQFIRGCKNLGKLIINAPIDNDALLFYNALPIEYLDISKTQLPSINTYSSPIKILKLPNTIKKLNIQSSLLNVLEIPNTVDTIENYAFAYNKNLISVTIPNSVKTIGENPFRDCTNLRYMKINCTAAFGDDVYQRPSPVVIDTWQTTIGKSIGSPERLEVLILRSNTVVKDLDTYLATPNQNEESEIMPIVNLDEWIGTPNNWLKIYVPKNLLAQYNETYPTLKNYIHPINGEDVNAVDTTPFIVVASLPDTPASGNEGKLHLVLNSEGEDGNLYDEYLWVNNKWEKIGEAKLDVNLDNYQEKLKGLYVSDIIQNGGYIQVKQKSYYDGVESSKTINFNTINGQSIFGQNDLKLPTLNELDVVETLADSVNKGLGETIKRTETLESKSQKLSDDMQTKASEKYVDDKCAEILNSSPQQLEVINEIRERLGDDSDIANVLTQGIADARMGLFIDLWNTACGQWGKYDYENASDQNAPFYLNELWLTYKEAIEIYQNWEAMGGRLKSPFEGKNLLSTYKAKTIIPLESYALRELTFTNFLKQRWFVDFSEIVILRIWSINKKVSISAGDINEPFFRSFRFTKWLDLVELQSNNYNINTRTILLGKTSHVGISSSLETFFIYNLNCNFNINDHSKLLLSTIRHLVDNRLPKSNSLYNSITITVHQDIYNALLGSASYPFNGGTQEEWEQLLQDAIAKDIAFVTM